MSLIQSQVKELSLKRNTEGMMESGEEKFFVSLDTSSTTSSLKFIPKKKKKPSPFKPPPVPPSLFIPNIDQLTDQLSQSHAGLAMMNQLLEQQQQQQQLHSLNFSSLHDQVNQHQQPQLNYQLQSMQHQQPLQRSRIPHYPLQQLHPFQPHSQNSPSISADDMVSLSSGHNELNHLLNPHTHYDVNNVYASFNPYVTTAQLMQGSSIQLQTSMNSQMRSSSSNGHHNHNNQNGLLNLNSYVCSGRTPSPPTVSRRPRPPPSIPMESSKSPSSLTSSTLHELQEQPGVIVPHAENSNIHHHRSSHHLLPLPSSSSSLPHRGSRNQISSHSSSSSSNSILFDQSSEQHNKNTHPTITTTSTDNSSSRRSVLNLMNLNSSSQVPGQQQSGHQSYNKKINIKRESTSHSSIPSFKTSLKAVQPHQHQSQSQQQQQSPRSVNSSSSLTLRPKCSFCASIIIDEECTEAEGGVYHINCFSCASCRIPLGGLQYIMHPVVSNDPDNQIGSNSKNNYGSLNDDDSNNSHARSSSTHHHPSSHSHQSSSSLDSSSPIKSPYCTSCFDSLFGEYCEGCGDLIHVAKGPAITHEGRSWHACHSCFKCYFCQLSLLGLPFLPHSSGFIFCSIKCSQESLLSHNKGFNPNQGRRSTNSEKRRDSRSDETEGGIRSPSSVIASEETRQQQTFKSDSPSHLHLKSNQKQAQEETQGKDIIQRDEVSCEEVEEVAVTPKNNNDRPTGDCDSSSTEGEKERDQESSVVHYHCGSHYARIQGKKGGLRREEREDKLHDLEEDSRINDDGEEVQQQLPQEVMQEKDQEEEMFLPKSSREEESGEEQKRMRDSVTNAVTATEIKCERRIDHKRGSRHIVLNNNMGNMQDNGIIEEVEEDLDKTGRDSGCHATDSSGSGSVSQEDNPVIKSSPELSIVDSKAPRLPSQPPPSLSPSSSTSSNIIIRSDEKSIIENSTPVSSRISHQVTSTDIEKVSKALKSVSFDPETMREKEGPSVVRRLRTSASRSSSKHHHRRSSSSKHRSSRSSSSRRHRRKSKHRGSPDASSCSSSGEEEDYSYSSSCSCSSCCSDSSSSSSSSSSDEESSYSEDARHPHHDRDLHDLATRSRRRRSGSSREVIAGEPSFLKSQPQLQQLSVSSLQQQVRSTQHQQQSPPTNHHHQPMIAIKQKKKNSFFSIFLPSFPSSSSTTNSTNSSTSGLKD